MRRAQFVLAIAAIVGVIVLIILHPKVPFFGKTDARVAALFDLVFGRRDAFVVSKQVEPVKQVSGIARRTDADVVIPETAPPPEKWSSDQADIIDEAVRRRLELEGHHLDAQVRVASQPRSPSGPQKATSDIGEVAGAGEREHITPSQLALGTPLSGEVSPVGDPPMGALLSPTYIKVLPPKDGWSNSWEYTDMSPVVTRAGAFEVHSSEVEAALQALPRGAANSGDLRRELASRTLIDKIVVAERTTGELNVGLRSPSVGSAMVDKGGRAYTIGPVGGGGGIAGVNGYKNKNAQSKASGSPWDDWRFSDAEVRAIYLRNQSAFDWVTARHIFISFGDTTGLGNENGARPEERARAKADLIHAELLQGADFAEMARSQSDDTRSAPTGGYLGRVVRGQMVPEFERAVLSLKAGEISPVVKTQYGFHIIRVDQRGSRPFAEVKAEIAGVSEQQVAWAQSYLTEVGVSYDDSYFGPATRRNLPTSATRETGLAALPAEGTSVGKAATKQAPAQPSPLPAAKPPRP
jgi:hypothetical protein